MTIPLPVEFTHVALRNIFQYFQTVPDAEFEVEMAEYASEQAVLKQRHAWLRDVYAVD